jgi:hypothetical protein
LASKLDAATDALATPDSGDEALSQWNVAAAEAIIAPWSNSLQNDLHNLRTRIALAAVFAGEKFEHGGLHRPEGAAAPTRAEWAFAALDHAVWLLMGKCETSS